MRRDEWSPLRRDLELEKQGMMLNTVGSFIASSLYSLYRIQKSERSYQTQPI